MKTKILTILSFLIPFYIYCYTLCPTISTYADAGEFPTQAFVNGFGHPPGYPLFILLIKLFQLLPFGNPALKANLCATFFAAATIPLFYLLVKKLTGDSSSAFAAGLVLAFSKIYWRNALVVEVFSLLAFFIVLTFYLFYLWQETKEKKYFWWFIIAAGLGLSHHQILLATLIPLFVWFLFAKVKKTLKFKDYLKAFLLGSVFFLLPYLYIVYSARFWPLLNWENPQNLAGFFRLLTRASYGTFILTRQAQEINWSDQIYRIAKMFLENFSLIGILIIFLGLISTFKTNRKFFFYSIFVILLIGLVFSLYSGMPLNSMAEIPYLERFQIIPSLFMALLLGFGITKLKFGRFSIFFLTLLPFLILTSNFSQVNQRGNYFGEYLAEDMFSAIPENSLFIIEGDAVINTLFYYQYALGKRKDVACIIGDLLVSDSEWYANELKTHYPDLVFPTYSSDSQYLTDFISLNSKKRNVFLYIPDLTQKLDISYPGKIKGLVWQYSQECPTNQQVEAEILSLVPYRDYKNLKNPPRYPKDWPESSLLNLYINPYVYLAEQNHEDLEKAEKYYKKALEIISDSSLVWQELGDDYEMHEMVDQAVFAWKKSLENTADERLAKALKEKIKKYQND